MRSTFFRWWGFSINEGYGPINIHISWWDKYYWFFFYLFFFGKRIDFMIKKKLNNRQTEREIIEDFKRQGLL